MTSRLAVGQPLWNNAGTHPSQNNRRFLCSSQHNTLHEESKLTQIIGKTAKLSVSKPHCHCQFVLESKSRNPVGEELVMKVKVLSRN